ncbi:ribosome hibernation-promoting factor, HPF/YfiA family [Carbonactinospora thermoautotrophica]|uniref:ribosome hibernation-promoting factor, HPF/YfiA family n=1 Tax=Carbonactinospora thermoautotrophica TaxID=1469144 RepID=UPI003DA7A8FA
MDIVVKGRRTEVAERFRQHVIEKLTKLTKHDGKVISMDVEVTKERNPRLSGQSDRVEITCYSRGPVIRAEASAADPYSAFDVAMAKLENRLRKAADRRRIHHGRRTPVSVAAATAHLNGENTAEAATATASTSEAEETLGGPASEGVLREEGPLVVREKIHKANPMTLDQALYEMELVGHDFYLFVDKESNLPSVVYRRRGYDYGVIRLET